MSDFFVMLLEVHNLQNEVIAINLDKVAKIYSSELLVNGKPGKITTFIYIGGSGEEVIEDYEKVMNALSDYTSVISL